ncbi:MAG: MerR family transcriptional regulator [Acidobacteriota bacterium]|nr:MerR family transcriptional regulator [Acidobacteriota bacterium]
MTRKWFKIGEAARHIGVGPKELRYWETQIPEIKPRRSKGNLRYYHVDELPRLHRIHAWISEGLTVSDCRELLLTGQLAKGLHEAMGMEPPATSGPNKPKKSNAAKNASPAEPAIAQIPESIPKDGLEAIAAALRQLHQRLAVLPDFSGR